MLLSAHAIKTRQQKSVAIGEFREDAGDVLEVWEREIERMRARARALIRFDEIQDSYFFFENIDYIKSHPRFMSRWASWAIYKFRLKYHKVDLETLFHFKTIRVYGLPRLSSPTESEAEILVKGILSAQDEKTIVYKFRHIDPDVLYRSYSYAFYVNSISTHGDYWVFFPNASGIDSGGAHHTYRYFEELIALLSNNLEVDLRKIDVPYPELESFLYKNSTDFRSLSRDNQLEDFAGFSRPYKVLENSIDEFESFIKKLENNEYSSALRDLRALVQQSLENLIETKDIETPKLSYTNINQLASILIDKGIIENRLKAWFEAFTSYANLASHRSFPTSEEMKNSVFRKRMMLTYYLGLQLLNEMENVM